MNTTVKKKACIAALFLSIFTILISDSSNAQAAGCPDPAAINYSASATVNNGSCTYKNASVKPSLNTKLTAMVNETSGLLYWNGSVWTHNDSGGEPALYQVDTSTGKIKRTVTIANATNIDWEDIAQDDSFIYIGDFGNNAAGNRTDLKIYKVRKSDIKPKTTVVSASIISFSYNDQLDFTPKANNTTNFDCEAMVAYNDSLFLFSKDWTDNRTRLYRLPKTPGAYSAINTGELNVQGLITGAEIIPGKRVIALTGYNSSVSPFIYLLYDFTGNHFFDANQRKLTSNQNFLQMEGICALSDSRFFISNERFEQVFVTPAKLQSIELSSFLEPYYSTLSSKTLITRKPVHFFAKPAGLQSF